MTTLRENFPIKLKQGEDCEQELLAILLQLYPMAKKMEGNHKAFDFLIPELDMRLELKFDVMARDTNNWAIEVMCMGKPSGLLTTEAQIWIQAHEDAFYFMNTGRLRTFLKKQRDLGKFKLVKGGDDLASELVLIWRERLNREDWIHKHKRNDPYVSMAALRGFIERFYIPKPVIHSQQVKGLTVSNNCDIVYSDKQDVLIEPPRLDGR